MNERADVVVAGAGAAGLAAALRCAEAGRSVVLCEASEDYRESSNTAMSTSMVPAGGSRWQRAAGIEDSPELFRADVERKTSGSADPVITAALTGVAPELVEWLADGCGVPLELVTDFHYPGHSRDRCHSVPDRAGRTLHGHLSERRAERDEITFAMPMRLVDLDADGCCRVERARLEPPGGSAEWIGVEAVVLATGGYGADRELVASHVPEMADALYFGGDGCRGDGLRLGLRLGADSGYLDAYQGHGSVADPHGVLVTWAAVMHGAMLLNADGGRFGDETTGYSEYAERVLAQPGRISWMVYDERIEKDCLRFADYRTLSESGAVRWTDDAVALAGLMGASPEAVSQTLDAAGQAALGAPDRFGRAHWEAPLEPPFAAVKVTGALFHTQGGLLVDERARVLRDGEPISGLYAAGGAAAGMSGHGAAGYLAGNGLLGALGLGYLAGKDLAA